MYVSELDRGGGGGNRKRLEGGLKKQERWGKRGGWVGGGADVSRAEDELHAKTQSHRCLRYSLERGGGRKENRNNIKSEAVLTHSPAGHHIVNRPDRQTAMQSTWNQI